MKSATSPLHRPCASCLAPGRHGAALLWIGMALALAWVPATAAQTASLQAIPEVTLEAAEQSVRDQLAEQRAQLNALLEAGPELAQPGQREALARAYGELGQLYVLYDLAWPAEAALANAIELAPQEARWRYLLATMHQLDNRLDAAAAGFRAVLELSPNDSAARIRLGDVLLRGERYEAAAQAYRLALEVPGSRAAALFGLGRVAVAQGDQETAAQRFAEALAEQPEASVLHFHLGQAYRDLGDSERARFHFANRGDQEVRFDDPVALELQQLAGGVGALLSLGRISLAMGELDAAEQRFTAATELDPTSASALKSLASVVQRKGDMGRALELYEKAVQADPDDAALRYFVARFINNLVVVASDAETAREQRTRWDGRAREHLQVALDIAPDFVPAWVLLAEVLQRQGALAEAEAALRSALAVAPDEFDLHYLHAKALAKLGQKEQGLAALGRFDAALQGTGQPLASEVRIERARLLHDLGQTEAALRELRTLGQVEDPNVTLQQRATALSELGNLATEEGELEQAADFYRESIAADASNPLVHFNLGTVLGRLGNFPEAAAAHAAASRLDPESQQARFSEAMAWVLAGDYTTARTRLEAGLEKFPAAIELAHLLTRILIAAPDASVRDPEVGLDLAFRLFDAVPSTQHAETVAMGLAAIERFDKAVEWQERVVQELEKGAPPEVVAQANQRLATYRGGKTVIAPWQQ